jgi:hypothetical protein
VRALVVVKANPVTNDSTGVLQTLKAVPVCALLLECPDHPLDHPVLLWAVGRDELLLQPIAFDQGCVAAAREDQTVVLTCPLWPYQSNGSSPRVEG